jgi:hypothetical protein
MFSAIAPKCAAAATARSSLEREVVEEGALGDTGHLAELVDGGRGIALAADHGERRVEQSCASVFPDRSQWEYPAESI